MPTGEDITCVQKSQLIRLLAHYFPFIHDNDIIVTADVDAFVMTEDLYKPLTLDKVSLKLFILLDKTWLSYMLTFIDNRGWTKKKFTNAFKSGGNILGHSASKC